MTTIETPLLILGGGPGALVAAKTASGAGLASMVVGHDVGTPGEPVELDERSISILEPHGVLGVLRPYAASQQPFVIAPDQFEHGLKHHCVADMLITVYDGMAVTDLEASDRAVTAKLTDSNTNWSLSADRFLDSRDLPAELNASIQSAADFVTKLLAQLRVEDQSRDCQDEE